MYKILSVRLAFRAFSANKRAERLAFFAAHFLGGLIMGIGLFLLIFQYLN